MVVFWVVLGLITLTIFIMAIDKKHHKITTKEQAAITTKTITDIKEQQTRVFIKHNSTIKANEVKR